MTASKYSNWFRPLCALIARRSRARLWAYGFFLLFYLPTAFLYAADTQEARWPLLIPIVVVVGQMVYPTLLGWLLILIPVLDYSATALYAVLGEGLPSLFHLVLLLVVLGICAALIAARPKRIHAYDAL